jgi:monothiol glutaredoxin
MSQENIKNQIHNIIIANDIVLFMKGTKTTPECGFSDMVVRILISLGADFTDVNVLVEHEMRQGIKDFSDWPTIPQLYVRGKFIGGCDIIRDLYQNAKLAQVLKERKV